MTRVRALFSVVLDSVPLRAVRKLGADDGTNWAIVIAWNALTAMFPIALALAAIAGFALSLVGVGEGAVYRLVLSVIPNDLGGQRQALAAVQGIQQHSGVFALVALAGFLWTAANLFGAMEQAFDRVYGCQRRSFVPQKLMGLLMMLIFSVLAVIAVGTSALLPLLGSLPGAGEGVRSGAGTVLVQIVIGVVAGFVLFLALYTVVPNRPLRPRQTWAGALFAGAAFELLTLAFPLYISLNQGVNSYGKSFAFLFVILAFFYFVGLITMLGVELNSVLAERSPGPAPAAAARESRSGLTPDPERKRRSPRGTKRVALGLLGTGIGLVTARRRR